MLLRHGLTHATLPQYLFAAQVPMLCTTPPTRYPNETAMEVRVSYEHSLASAPDEFIVLVPSQVVANVPANIPRALLAEYVARLIIERSPSIGRIRNLRLL